MKKLMLLVAVAVMLASCGFTKNSSSSNTTAQSTTTTSTVSATSAGQGAGSALYNLYNQYKANGNKYDYKNMQNVMNCVSLLANCEGLKDNYKDKAYLKEFGRGMIASSLGLVNQNNVESVTNSLVDMVKNSDTVQEAKTQTQSTANTAAGYANTAATYASAIGSLLSAFGGN